MIFFITEIPFPEKALQLLDSTCVYASHTLRQQIVTPEIVNHVLSQQTNTPTQINDELKSKLLHIEEELQKRVINQNEAINELAGALRRSFFTSRKKKKTTGQLLIPRTNRCG